MRILLAEDERDLNMLVTRRLRSLGHGVDSVYNGTDAVDALLAAEYDAAILDIMMPGPDGFEVLRRLRESGRTTPVLFLTARDAVADRVRGLDGGANDYLVKPFSFDELTARLRAMTRSGTTQTDATLRVADLVLDSAARTVERGGRPIVLTAREFAFLEYLMQNRGVVLSREKIEDHLWSFDYEGGTNIVDVYIRYLRRKLDDGFPQKLIHTVRGSGYVLREEP